MNLEETPLLGVQKKILGQVDAFRKCGIDTLVIDATRDSFQAEPGDLSGIRRAPGSSILTGRNLVTSIAGKARTVSSLIDRVRREGPVVLYVRRTIASPGSVGDPLDRFKDAGGGAFGGWSP